jgi:hypothetical protein
VATWVRLTPQAKPKGGAVAPPWAGRGMGPGYQVRVVWSRAVSSCTGHIRSRKRVWPGKVSPGMGLAARRALRGWSPAKAVALSWTVLPGLGTTPAIPGAVSTSTW